MMRILALLIFAALRGRFAPMVANMGDRLRGFAQFESGNGQAYEFSRD